MKTKASIPLLLAGTLWGCIGIFQKMLVSMGLTSLEQAAVRSGVAALVYGIFLFFTDRQALKISPKHWYYFFGSGICALLFFNWCYFNAITASSMAVAAVLLYTSPIIVTLLSALLFGEALTPVKLCALFVTILGCILVTGVLPLGGHAVSAPAILYGLGSAFGYALYSIIGKLALRHYSSQTVTFYTFLFAAACAIPLSGLHRDLALLAAPPGIIGALGIGILCCILPYALYTEGLQHTEAGRASILATSEPFVAALLGIVVFREAVTAFKLLGMAAIFGAILLLNLPSQKK